MMDHQSAALSNSAKLQHEFSPVLDSALIQAILLDHPDVDASPERYQTLRSHLAELAAHAVEAASATDQDDDLCHLTSENGVSASSETSSVSTWPLDPSFNDALRFVKTAFPRLSERDIMKTLKAHSETLTSEQIDMNAVVLDLLSQEYIADNQERGWENLDHEYPPAVLDQPDPSTTESGSNPPSEKRKKSGKTRTILINDIRQQHHVSATVAHRSQQSQKTRTLGAIEFDPWTQLSSLSTFLSELIPSSQPSDFSKYLHNPIYTTPSKAVRAALEELFSRRSRQETVSGSVLTHFLEVLHSTHDHHDDLTLEDRDRLIKDSGLALGLCGTPDVALVLVNRLIELDIDSIQEKTQGIYHSQVSKDMEPTVPQSLAVPNGVRTSADLANTPPLPLGSSKSAPDGWHTIPRRPQRTKHPLADSIPAYANLGISNNRPEKYESHHQHNRQRVWRRRKELLTQASHYWRQGQRVGGTKSVGGEIALFYADRARKLAEECKLLDLESAKARVAMQRSSGSTDTIDLHGLTVEESLYIVQAILDEGGVGCFEDRPLTIITGAGNHSASKGGILLPALLRQLSADGWELRKLNAGIIVSGKSNKINRNY